MEGIFISFKGKPKIGDKKKDFDYEDIKKTVKILYVTSLLATIVFLGISYYINSLELL